MPNNDYNYGPSYVMNSDKTSHNDPMGSNQLYREKKEFSTTIDGNA